MQEISKQKPKGLAKIWREIKRPFKSLSESVANNRSRAVTQSITHVELIGTRHHQPWIDRVFIGNDQKVHLPNVEYCLVYGCNLKCEYCSAFSPFRSGFAPKEELVDSFAGWSLRLAPEEIRLLGGEPLLHPKFDEIVETLKKHWPDSQIVVYTNGVHLPKLEDRVLRRLSEAGIEMRVSQHLNTEQYNRELNQSIKRLQQFGICLEIILAYDGWLKFHRIGNNGKPLPFSSNPAIAWSVCPQQYCPCIVADRLYRCSRLSQAILGVHEKKISSSWECVLSHQPVTLANSTQETLKYLTSKYFEECSVCPETVEVVEAKQLTIEQIRQALP